MDFFFTCNNIWITFNVNNIFSFQINNVERFLLTVNATLRHQEEHEEMRQAMARIEQYDAVVSR